MDNLINEFAKIDSYLRLENKYSIGKNTIDKILYLVSYNRKIDTDYIMTQETNKSKYKYKR
jgi:hypothetical protein